MKNSQYGLKGDISTVRILKVLSFHSMSTLKLIANLGGKLSATANFWIRIIYMSAACSIIKINDNRNRRTTQLCRIDLGATARHNEGNEHPTQVTTG